MTAYAHAGDQTWAPDSRLGRELQEALAKTRSEDIRSWALRSAARVPTAVLRRSVRLGAAVWRGIKQLAVETGGAIGAGARGELGQHLESRGRAAVAAAHGAARGAAKVAGELGGLAARMRTDPLSAAPELLGFSIAFLTGSGGLDGDGGIPDLDLAAGIGAHRSIFTHSIIAGAVAEALIACALELVLLVHAKLPRDHDPRWDALALIALRTGAAAKIGVDLGLATHLAIDGTVDGMTPYKDLPASLPIEAHRAILLANAGIEAAVAAEGITVLAGAPTSAEDAKRRA